jgi:hypothetical protein
MALNNLFNKYIICAIASVSLGVALWSCHSSDVPPAKRMEKHAPASASTHTATEPPVNRNAPITPLNEMLPDPLAAIRLPNFSVHTLATRGSVAELRRLSKMHSLRDAKIAAAQSDDPVVWINSLYMGLECIMPHFSRDAQSVKSGEDDPIKARIDRIVANWMPYRVHIPLSLERSAALHDLPSNPTTARQPKYTELDFEQFMQAMATVSQADRAAFDLIRARMHEACGASEEVFGLLFRENRQRWVDRGVLGALIFDEKSGWTSGRRLDDLSDRDYELVARAIAERSPDGLARLYLSTSAPIGNFLREDAPQDSLIWGLAAPEMTRKLVLCELGLADCSGGSSFHVGACGMHGGCHEPDLAALIRYVLARDGLAPDLIDRNVARVLDAIRRGDLHALGIRRKPKS